MKPFIIALVSCSGTPQKFRARLFFQLRLFPLAVLTPQHHHSRSVIYSQYSHSPSNECLRSMIYVTVIGFYSYLELAIANHFYGQSKLFNQYSEDKGTNTRYIIVMFVLYRTVFVFIHNPVSAEHLSFLILGDDTVKT